MHTCRRRLLGCAAGAALCAFMRQVQAAAGAGRPRELWITRPQAQESVRAVYWADGALQPDGYRLINRLYRDLHAGVEHPVSLRLLDLNFALQAALARASSLRPMILLSGFRTAATNRRVGGVEPSEHEAGRADDFIYEGLSLDQNVALAQRFQVGGLGIYPDRGSLHKDVGALRTWVEYGRTPAPPDPVRINPEPRGGSSRP